MLTAFLLQNLHFAINIFAAMVFLWCFWLYFDIWKARRSPREILKFLGYFFLSISFLAGAASLESTVFPSVFISESLRVNFLISMRVAGYLLLGAGVYLDPILARPKHGGEKEKMLKSTSSPALMLTLVGVEIPLSVLGYFTLPILSAVVGVFYLYRATLGFEYHLRKVSYAFLGLSLYELVSLGELFKESSNVALNDLVSSFSPYWYLSSLLLAISTIILGKWVFSYLLKRLSTQLYIFFSTAVLLISILSTVTFTYFLFGNVREGSLDQLEVNVKVLDYSLDSKSEVLKSDARVLSENENVIEGIVEDRRINLTQIASDFLVSKKLSSLTIVDANGQVLARGEDSERVGESVSGNKLFQRAIDGQGVTSIVSNDGVLGPEVLISSAHPVYSGDKIVGVALASFAVDNAFVDGIKKATGLQTSIYGGNKISATTFSVVDGLSRRVGVAESSEEVINTVLGEGEVFLGEISFLNTPYYAAYLPLRDIDGVPVGMLFVGEPQVTVLTAAGRSIQGTFVFSAILWILASIPSYLIASYISRQLK